MITISLDILLLLILLCNQTSIKIENYIEINTIYWSNEMTYEKCSYLLGHTQRYNYQIRKNMNDTHRKHMLEWLIWMLLVVDKFFVICRSIVNINLWKKSIRICFISNKQKKERKEGSRIWLMTCPWIWHRNER